MLIPGIPDFLTIAGGIAIGAYVLTQVLVRFPGTRLWVQSEAIKGYAYLDKVKKDGLVTKDLEPIWSKAYRALDGVILAFEDDEVKPSEFKRMAFDAISLVNEARKCIGF